MGGATAGGSIRHRTEAASEETGKEVTMAQRVVLAYSGGLDTSIAVRWLMENHGVEVIAVAVDVGQAADSKNEDWDAIRKRALAAGAIEATVIDARAEMAEDFCMPALLANAKYEGKYPLVSALSRPVIVRHLVAEARRHGASAVAHGCTGKGNDQVRFEVGTRALAPDLEVIAPARVWGLTREDSIEYAAKWDIPLSVTKEKLYSIDENLWGRAIECGVIEDPWNQPPADVYTMTRPTAVEPTEVVIGFESGIPVSVDGRQLSPELLIAEVNRVVGSYGWGRLDMVESRRVGIKSRETYECPGALALLLAHADLEDLTLERDLLHEKARLEPRWSELVYDGLWFSPLKQALDAFFVESQRHVTGEVRLHLEPGQCFVVGRRSPIGLYDHGLATYDATDTFRHQDAEGFVRLWGLGVATWSAKQVARTRGDAPHGGGA
jgi:argininosuccinate synthase